MLLTSSGGVEAIVQLVTVLIIFVLVLGMTLFVTRWIAGFQKNQMAGSNITVIETTKISPNQYIQIVKVGERYLAIAVSKDSITKLTDLDETEIDLEKQKMASADFSTVFKQFRSTLRKEEEEKNATSKDEE